MTGSGYKDEKAKLVYVGVVPKQDVPETKATLKKVNAVGWRIVKSG
jgi:hypothetical protein